MSLLIDFTFSLNIAKLKQLLSIDNIYLPLLQREEEETRSKQTRYPNKFRFLFNAQTMQVNPKHNTEAHRQAE